MHHVLSRQCHSPWRHSEPVGKIEHHLPDTPMARIALFAVNPVIRRQLSFTERVATYDCHTDVELFRVVRARACNVAVVNVSGSDGQPMLSFVQRLAKVCPMVRIVAYIDWIQHRGSAISAVPLVMDAGADDVVIGGVDSVARIRHGILMGGCEAFVLRHIKRATGTQLTDDVLRFVEYATLNPERSASVNHVAAALRIPRKRFIRQCEREQLPPPQELLSWARLLVATLILEQPEQSVNSVGQRMFGSPSAFRNMLRRYVAVNATDLHDMGGFGWTITLFQAILRQPVGEYLRWGMPDPSVDVLDPELERVSQGATGNPASAW